MTTATELSPEAKLRRRQLQRTGSELRCAIIARYSLEPLIERLAAHWPALAATTGDPDDRCRSLPTIAWGKAGLPAVVEMLTTHPLTAPWATKIGATGCAMSAMATQLSRFAAVIAVISHGLLRTALALHGPTERANDYNSAKQ